MQVALIPVAELFGDDRDLRRRSSAWSSSTSAFGLPFAIFLLRNFFAEIPRELLEAARLDGAGEIRLFTPGRDAAGRPGDRLARHLPVPVGVERHAGRADLRGLASSQPITVALQQQVRQFGNNIDVLAPGAFVSMVIPLAVFFAFQRQFVSGVMAGAVK